MPATRKRSRKHQFQSGDQKKTKWTARPAAAAATAGGGGGGGGGGDGDGVDSPADFPFLTTCMTENLETRARNQG